MSREMVNSGIPWIGDIPRGWVMKRLKDVGFLYGGLTGKAGDDFIAEDDESCNYMRFIPFTNIFNNTIINPNQLYKVRIDDGEKQNLVNKNDILFLMSSEDYDGVGKPAILEEQIENLSLNSFCKGFRVTNVEMHPKYLLYLLLSHVVRELVRQEAKGFIRINLRQDKLSTCPIMLPSLSEQQKIALFLDRKCAEIDEMIALQEKIVEELKAYKQTVITEAVTKGLNPDVPMKESGIDWIDYVPQHWQIRKMKSLIDLKSGSNLTSMDISDKENGYLVYGGNGVRGTYGDYSHEGEYVLIGRQGALCGNINYAGGKFWVTEHALVCYPKEKCVLKWLGESLRAMDLNQYSLSAAQPGLSAERIKNIYMIVPPITEQNDIAEYLDAKCTEIDNLISIKLSKIDSLKEYKKSIIYEYVTGKKEVE